MLRTLYALTYVGAIAGSVCLTPLVVNLSRRWGVIDLPNSRKVHQNPTPRLGGLAIAASMILISLIALLAAHAELDRRILVVSATAIFVLVVGVFDDLLNLPSKFKLLALIAASTAVCGIGVRIDTIILHGDVVFSFGWFAWPLTILWIVGMTVSINFIDGLDGLAAGIAAIACAVIAVTASCSGQFVLAIIALSLLGSLTGFLFFNFNPAKVFMGDCGSMFIGFALASLSLLQSTTVGTTVGLMLPVLALSVPILDTLLTLIRRTVIHRGSMFAAERGHIHHRLLDLGLCQRHAVLVLYSASVVSAAVGLLALLNHGWPTVAALALLLPLLIGLFRVAGSTRVRETIAAIRRNRAIRRESNRYARVFEDLQLRFRTVKDFEGWWTELCAAAERLDFVSIQLPLTRRDDTRHLLQWRRNDVHHDESDVLEATVPIRQRRQKGMVRARVEVATTTFLETAGLRVALFSRLMGDYSLLSLPELTRRIRTRGPAGEKSGKILADHGETHENGNGNGRKNGNGHHHLNDAPGGEVTHLNGEEHIAGRMLVMRLIRSLDGGQAASDGCPGAPLETSDLPPHYSASRDLSTLKVAVVHDFLYCYAGAERVLEQILRVFPHADLFSLFDFLPADQRGFIQDKPVKTSFIQRMPFCASKASRLSPVHAAGDRTIGRVSV